MADLKLKKTRDRLKMRRAPHWQKLREGEYIGYCRTADTWRARKRIGEKQQYEPLGEGLDYDAAQSLAEAWLAKMRGATVTTAKKATVKDALLAYIADLTAQGRPKAAADALCKFKTCIWEDPLANIEMRRLTQDDSKAWLARLVAPRVAPQVKRTNRSANRMLRSYKAGLTATQGSFLGNPKAWDIKPLADDVEDAFETAVYLNADHRRALIKAASDSAALFLEGLERTGARPGELAAATVADLTGDSLRLVHHKGRSGKIKVRHVILDTESTAFFKKQTRGKLPAAPLFTEDGKQIWRKHTWGRAVRAAIKAVNAKAKANKRIPPNASAYSFRHARISELLQIHKVDALITAEQTGTSVAMVEKAYLKFFPSAMRETLNRLREPKQ